MSDNVRSLVVSLYLNTSQFEKNIRLMNNEIKQAENEFKTAALSSDRFEKTLGGMKAKAKALTQQLGGQVQVLDQYQRKLDVLEAKQEEQKDLYDKLKKKRDEEQKTIDKSRRAIEMYSEEITKLEARGTYKDKQAEYREEIERLNGVIAESTEEVKKLDGQMKAQANTLGTTKQKIQQTQTAMSDAEYKAEQLRLELNKMESAWYRSGVAMQDWAERASGTFEKVDRAGSAVTTAVTMPILSAGVAAAKAGIDYENAFANVRKTVDATGEDTEAFFSDLSENVLEMSRTLATSATDITEVMAIAGQLGIENDRLAEFTDTIVRLGMSTNLAGEEGAKAMAQFANITGMEQSQFANMGAALVALGNHFATTEADIMTMSTRIAAAGAQVGLSESQILGFATALSSLGLEADAGGSAFSKALKKMEVAVATGNDQLADFARVADMTDEAFSEMWENDPAAAFEAFIVGLSKMDEEGIGAIATLEEIGFKELRLSDTMLRTANATELLSEAQAMANESWTQGTALFEESNTKLQTTASRLTNAKNSLVAAGINFADTLAPEIEMIVGAIEKAVDWVGSLDDETRRNIVTWGAYAAAAGPAIKVFGKFGTGIVKTVGTVGKFAQKIGEAGAAFKTAGSLGSAFSTLISPGGALMLGMAGAIAGLAALYTHFKRVEEAKPDFSLDTSDIENYKIDTQELEAKVNVDTKIDFTGEIDSLYSQLVEELTDGERETEEDRKFMRHRVQMVVDDVYEQLDEAIAQKRKSIETSYSLGLISEEAYNEAVSTLTGQGDTLKGDLQEKGDAIAAYVTGLSESNKKMTEDEIDTLNALLEALGATVEQVNDVTTAQTDAYKFAYEKTRLGFGTEEDQRMALEYIELMASRKITEIEAEKAALEATYAATTEGQGDEEKTRALEQLREQTDALDQQIAAINELKKLGFTEVAGKVLEDYDIDPETLKRFETMTALLREHGIDTTDGLSFFENLSLWTDELNGKLGQGSAMNDWLNQVDGLIAEMDESGLFTENSPLKTMLATLADQEIIPKENLDSTYGMIGALTQLMNETQPAVDAVKALESDTAAAAANILPGAAQAVTDSKGELTDAMTEAAEEVKEVFPEVLDEHSPSRVLYSQGYNAMMGFRNGVRDGRSAVIAAMREAARAAVNAAKDELQIHSPSRVFEDEVGAMAMKGFGRGFMREAQTQSRAIRNAARYMTSEAKGGVASGNSDNRRTYSSESNVTVTGNTFVVNDRQDVQALASEIAAMTRQSQRGRGLRMA